MRDLMRVLAVAILLGACSSAKIMAPASSTNPSWLIDLAKQKVGDHATIEPNITNTFFLCWQDQLNSANVPALQFIIVRAGDHRIVEQGSVTMAEIHWINDHEALVSPKQGQVELQRNGGNTTRTIDVRKYQ